MLDGNPDVDEIWEVDYYDTPGNFAQWARFEAEAKARQKRGDFDEIFLTQIALPNFHLWTDGVRFAIYRAYPHPITVETAPVLRLSEREIENVRDFAARHGLNEKSAVVLFECAPRSAQSRVNAQFARQVAAQIVAANPAVAVVLSSNYAFDSEHPNIVDGSVLSLRENAELTKYCSLLIGASSGVTWISTSDWAKPLPMIQLIVPDAVRGNSPTHDFEKRGLPTGQIIEMHDYRAPDVAQCVKAVLAGDLAAKAKWGQKTPLGLRRLSRFAEVSVAQFAFEAVPSTAEVELASAWLACAVFFADFPSFNLGNLSGAFQNSGAPQTGARASLSRHLEFCEVKLYEIRCRRPLLASKPFP